MIENPKFRLEVRLTEADYVRYNRVISWREPKTKVLALLMSLLAAGIVTAIFYASNLFTIIPQYVLYFIPVLMFAYTYWQFPKNADKQAARNFHRGNMEIEWDMAFFDDRVEVTANGNKSVHPYKDLTEIVITDTDIYLMYAKIMGYCIRKEECPQALIDLLENERQKKL